MDKELEKWFEDSVKIAAMLADMHKINFAKRLKILGIELLYGIGKYPISMSYKEKIKSIKPDSKLGEILRHIDLKTWNKA